MVSQCREPSPSQWLFVLQTQNEVKFLYGKKKKAIRTRLGLWHKTTVTGSYRPGVRGWTESRALVNRATSFRGPPLARCWRWCSFNSHRGTKRFIILWNWTSTWGTGNPKLSSEEESLLLTNRWTDRVPNLPCSTWGCPACCWHRSERLSCQTECGPRRLPSRSDPGNRAERQTYSTSQKDSYVIPTWSYTIIVKWRKKDAWVFQIW